MGAVEPGICPADSRAGFAVNSRSFGVDGAVSRDLSIFQYQARVPVMEPHLFPLAVYVIKSSRVERIVCRDMVTLEAVVLHDSQRIGCWRTEGNPSADLVLKRDRVCREAARQGGKTC